MRIAIWLVAQLVRVYARQAEVLDSNPSDGQIFYFFRHVLSSVLPCRSVGRCNFDRGLHNNNVDSKRHEIEKNHIYVCVFG